MRELYITALLKSIDETSSWEDVLKVNIPKIFNKNQTLIERVQEAILEKGKRIRGVTRQILSPFSFNKEVKNDFFISSSQLVEMDGKEKHLLPTYYPNFEASNGIAFQTLLKEFKTRLKSVTSEEQILPLMRQYFSLVAADDTGVSLYDYARLTAAIVCCLSSDNEGEESPENESKKPIDDLLFIKGDVSGIQDFIFNITSKKAAKSLKTRSFRVQVLAKLAIQYILEKFKLYKANLLYDGGGNFYIFAPASKEAEMAELKKYFAKELLEDDLQIHLGFTKVQLSDLTNFGDKWKEVARSIGEDKLQLFKPLSRKEIFAPMDAFNLTEKREEEAKEYGKISSKLNKTKGFRIEKSGKKAAYNKFGYAFELQEKQELKKDSVVFNSFYRKQSDFTFAVTKMPQWTKQLIEDNLSAIKQEIEVEQQKFPNQKDKRSLPSKPEKLKGKIIEFHWLAHFAYVRTGTKKLGVVKMDIDGLGNLFKGGLKKDRNSVAHIAALSRALKWFFEGYMNALLDTPIYTSLQKIQGEKETFRDNIYVLFSGGDDFFLVGAWDMVLEFAAIVRREFMRLNNNTLTISAGYVLTDPKFPVIRFATLADDAESDAKNYNQKYVKEKKSKEAKKKDKMAVFGQVISWQDMEAAEGLRNQLFRLVKDKGEPRSVIGKVKRSMYGYNNIHQKLLQKDGIAIPRLWRLNQFLRTVKKSNRAEAQKIIDLYEITFENALKNDENAANPAFIAVAARWAEFLTRKK